MSTKNQPWHIVQRSPLHGNGVFAARDIPAGTRIIEYIGARITPEQADERHPVNPDDPFHTFYFSLSSGKVIDGGKGGNDARWINHSCDPNCETEENAAGTRVYVMALRDIAQGEELFYDYGLVMDGKITKKLQAQYGCLCGSDNCRGTMLALPEPDAQAPADTDTTSRQLAKLRKKHKKLKKRVCKLEEKVSRLLEL
ncbi:MAG TPA: SET domain-containing protein-lysine N-methyltransferase [Pusillimonas sp.]|uniref:SET domain-containing protein n=1 Tax=Pusillimonas sp. TaxID=3040095 RepID=UPI002CC7E979|nr:SET domain-containing protein-lysine N-methyltransferase [Pusillimonas sp.]HUH88227.1 SET domain-containing protein-lysine N-methyltransferase [Pusillimonas sp.]